MKKKIIDLVKLQHELQQIKVVYLKTKNMLIAEAVKLKNSIREVEMKSNLQNNNFQLKFKANI